MEKIIAVRVVAGREFLSHSHKHSHISDNNIILNYFYSYTICFFYSFDVNESTAHDAVSAFLVVVKEMSQAYIVWPDADEQELEMETFRDRTGTIMFSKTCTNAHEELHAIGH